MVSSILGQLGPSLGRQAVETSASANLISPSQAFQTGSEDADSLHRISAPFQGRCPQPAASVLPLPLAGAGRKAGQALVPLFSSAFPTGLQGQPGGLCPQGVLPALPAAAAAGAALPGAGTPQSTTHGHHWDTEGKVLICRSHSPKSSATSQKLLLLLILLLEQMFPVSAVCLHSDSPSLGLLQGHAGQGEGKALWDLWPVPVWPPMACERHEE